MEEPSAKRSRLDEKGDQDANFCFIKLDMNKYEEWVRDLSPEALVSIFEIGLKVKESAMLTVHVSEGFLEKALTSQMKPVRTNVANIEAEVRQKLQNVPKNVSLEMLVSESTKCRPRCSASKAI